MNEGCLQQGGRGGCLPRLLLRLSVGRLAVGGVFFSMYAEFLVRNLETKKTCAVFARGKKQKNAFLVCVLLTDLVPNLFHASTE